MQSYEVFDISTGGVVRAILIRLVEKMVENNSTITMAIFEW